MRPSRKLGGIVLLLLSTSGCAAVQSRFNDPARTPEQPASSRTSGWFGSRFWSRPTPTSASSTADTTVTPEQDPTRPTAPETDIWPGPPPSGLSRFLPTLGSRDGSKGSAPGDDLYPMLSSRSTPANSAGITDAQVTMASDDDASADAFARRQAARAKPLAADSADIAEHAPSTVAPRVPIKMHNRPEAESTVALDVEAVDLNASGDSYRGTNRRDLGASSTREHNESGGDGQESPVRHRPRRESYLLAASTNEADLTATGAG